jgi:hypothetical protein
MLEIRRNARGLVERLGRGESFRITYRNRTVGELFPPKVSHAIRSDDPVYCIAEVAEDLGGGLDARDADRIVYGL